LQHKYDERRLYGTPGHLVGTPTPRYHPSDEDLSLGTPDHPSDEDLSLGTPDHPSDEDLSLGTPDHPSDEDLSLGTPEARG